MKTLLFLLVLILLGLLLIFNWDSAKDTVTDLKQKFSKEQIECEFDTRYECGKKWVKNKLGD